MSKRYRAPKVVAGQIKIQRGKVDGNVDMCAFWGEEVSPSSASFLLGVLAHERFDSKGNRMPSVIEELVERGFDLDSLKLSINKHEQVVEG